MVTMSQNEKTTVGYAVYFISILFSIPRFLHKLIFLQNAENIIKYKNNIVRLIMAQMAANCAHLHKENKYGN